MTVSQHLLQKKKRNNGFTWMVDQISGEEEGEEGEEKKRTFFQCCIGPRKSPEAMRQKKSDLKRYFTIVVVVVWYSTFFTKLYLINTALHIGRTYLLLHHKTKYKRGRISMWFGNIGIQFGRQTFDCSWPKEGQPIKCLVSNWQPLYYAKISKTVKYLVLTYANQ